MSSSLWNIPSDKLLAELQRRCGPQELEGLSRRPAVHHGAAETFPHLGRLVVLERRAVKHPVHPFPEGGHGRFLLLLVPLGEGHAGSIGGGGGAGGRQHAGRVVGLRGALQRHGGVGDGPDLGLGLCALKARVGVEGGVLLVDGRELGTLRRQSLFFLTQEGRGLAGAAVLGEERRPGFAV